MNEKVEKSKTRHCEYRIVRGKTPPALVEAITPNGLMSFPYFYSICVVIVVNKKIVAIHEDPVKLSSCENNMDHFINIINEVKKLPMIDAETFDFVSEDIYT